jgi:uncharacterized damage-inducible protein DinB
MDVVPVARQWQLDQLRHAIRLYDHLLANVSQSAATTFRDGGDGWTVVEVMGHMRDFEALFVERAKLTVTVDEADLPFPDPATLAVERKYNTQNLREVYDAWVTNRHAYLDYLNAREPGDWSRTANHPKRGPFSLDA